jgi:hypothetical protein
MPNDDDERMVSIMFTVTSEYILELELPDMAKKLGIPAKKLVAIIDNGEDIELSDAAESRVTKAGEVTSEEFSLDDIAEV